MIQKIPRNIPGNNSIVPIHAKTLCRLLTWVFRPLTIVASAVEFFNIRSLSPYIIYITSCKYIRVAKTAMYFILNLKLKKCREKINVTALLLNREGKGVYVCGQYLILYHVIVTP